MQAAFDDIIRRTGDRLREALTRIAPGEYTFEDVMDDDGVGTTNIPIKLRITVPPHGSNRKVLFDFTGTGPQVKGNINVTMYGDARPACSIRSRRCSIRTCRTIRA